MSLEEHLRAKSGEYELLAEWHAERAPIDERHAVAGDAMVVIGIVLREIADAVELDWRKDGEAS
jgi:hypothetical protein